VNYALFSVLCLCTCMLLNSIYVDMLFCLFDVNWNMQSVEFHVLRMLILTHSTYSLLFEVFRLFMGFWTINLNDFMQTAIDMKAEYKKVLLFRNCIRGVAREGWFGSQPTVQISQFPDVQAFTGELFRLSGARAL